MPYGVIAIMTVYHPTQIHVRNARLIMEQVDCLFVFDNSSVDSGAFFSDLKKCTYTCRNKNIGLSRAFNYVLKTFSNSISEDAVVLFFDQDTVIPENHISKLYGEFKALRNLGEPVGAIGPVYIDASDGKTRFPKHCKWLTRESVRVRTLITSSMLCEYSTLKEIGFWNEKIFLDMADWDLCWRFRRHGYSCCMTQASEICHAVGELRRESTMPQIIIWKPFRLYYQVRDFLRICEEKHAPFFERLYIFCEIAARAIYQILFFQDRKERLIYICLGVKDFFRGYAGAIKR